MWRVGNNRTMNIVFIGDKRGAGLDSKNGDLKVWLFFKKLSTVVVTHSVDSYFLRADLSCKILDLWKHKNSRFKIYKVY